MKVYSVSPLRTDRYHRRRDGQAGKLCDRHGIRGFARWDQEWVRSYRGEDPEECVKLNTVRQKLVDMWRPFGESLKDPQGTVKTCCQALYRFICENHIEKKTEDI